MSLRLRLASAPLRRAALALVLAGAVLFPGVAARHGAASCRAGRCPAREIVRWSRPLAGSWISENGIEGTIPSQGQAYAALGHGVAVIGSGLLVSAFDALTGRPRWTITLAGVPAGSAVMSVRAWPGVISVGVNTVLAGAPGLPAGAVSGNAVGSSRGAVGTVEGRATGGDAAGGTGAGSGARREEVLLDSATGRQIAMYPAAPSGGAVSAGSRHTVVVGPQSVTSYDNATGKPAWHVATGQAEQAWRVDGRYLYITVSAQGEVGTAPVTAVRQINLRTGAERLIQPASGAFRGTLSGAIDGVLVFSGPDGLCMYLVSSGRLSGRRAGATMEGIDPLEQVLYAEVGGGLIGLDPVTGQNEPGTRVPGPPGTYGVLGGVALGLDAGARGEAWGYSIASRHVVWTTRPLPWPHYFVDLSGLGGSSDPASGLVLLVTCARVGQVIPGGTLAGASAQACLRPKLVAIGPRGTAPGTSAAR